jgi:hypothetical protein
MYFRGLNEIFISLVCILNIVSFDFQIQTFFYSNQADTYFVTQNLTYKCTQLNSLLCRSFEEGILENLSHFLKKG